MDKREILEFKQHRPFELPNSPWVMQQSWQDLLFLHYRIPYDTIRSLVPSELEIDTYDNECWISISPFKMRNVRFRFLPPIPTAWNFLELNLRTYVKYNGRGGIYFFSLDTSSTLSALGARAAFLPYFRAFMTVSGEHEFKFRSQRKGTEKVPADFDVRYSPGADKFISKKGSLEEWLVERYCLFQRVFNKKVIEIDIHHVPWQLQNAEAEVRENTLTVPFGLHIPDQQPLIHYSENQDVLVWPLRVVSK